TSRSAGSSSPRPPARPRPACVLAGEFLVGLLGVRRAAGADRVTADQRRAGARPPFSKYREWCGCQSVPRALSKLAGRRTRLPGADLSCSPPPDRPAHLASAVPLGSLQAYPAVGTSRRYAR